MTVRRWVCCVGNSVRLTARLYQLPLESSNINKLSVLDIHKQNTASGEFVLHYLTSPQEHLVLELRNAPLQMETSKCTAARPLLSYSNIQFYL